MHSRPLLYKFLAVRRIPLKKYFNSLPIACHPERSELRRVCKYGRWFDHRYIKSNKDPPRWKVFVIMKYPELLYTTPNVL